MLREETNVPLACELILLGRAQTLQSKRLIFMIIFSLLFQCRITIQPNSTTIKGSLGLRITGISVPTEVQLGADVLLECSFDLEGSNLYALKWYKGQHGACVSFPFLIIIILYILFLIGTKAYTYIFIYFGLFKGTKLRSHSCEKNFSYNLALE